MKHIIIKSALLPLTVLLVACSSDIQEKTALNNRPLKLSFTIDSYVGDEDAETRTSLDAENHLIWSEGDTVGIYPDKGGQVYFEMADGAGASSASFDGGGWAFKETSEYYSYYPFIGDIYLDRTHIPVSFVGQVQTGMDATSHIGAFAPLYTPASTAKDGALSFNYHHLGCIIRPRVILPAGIYTKLAVTAPTDAFITSAYYDLTSDAPTLIPVTRSNQLTIDLNGFVLNEEKQFMVYLMSAPVDLAGTEITVSILDSEMNEYQFKKTPSKPYTPGYLGGLACTTYSIATDAERLIDPAEGMTNVPFEDDVFKAYMVENFDTDGDGEISFEEAESVQDIYLPTSGEKVTSLAGIEYCPHLMTLSCNNQQLEKLDVSRNRELTALSCSHNSISSLNLKENGNLQSLTCSSNKLTSLDLSNNTALTSLYCANIQLTSIDLSNNTALTSLYCANNQLTSIDLSNNTALSNLNCDYNQLTSIDLSNNTALTSLNCGYNQLTSIDLSNNTALTYLHCRSNQLTSLEVSNNTALTSLNCANNQLTSLDLSNNTAIKQIYCPRNLITSLDVSGITGNLSLYCAPMYNAAGENVLETVWIAEGQVIDGVTKNRSSDYVPSQTVVRVVGEPDDGGIEGLGDGGDWMN